MNLNFNYAVYNMSPAFSALRQNLRFAQQSSNGAKVIKTGTAGGSGSGGSTNTNNGAKVIKTGTAGGSGSGGSS